MPAGQVALCAEQPPGSVVARVDGVVPGEKVPAAQGAQYRSDEAVGGTA